MSRPVRKYTKEFKVEAVNLALKSPTISVTARELGLPVATLHTWIKQLKQSKRSIKYTLLKIFSLLQN
jgi:transposase